MPSPDPRVARLCSRTGQSPIRILITALQRRRPTPRSNKVERYIRPTQSIVNNARIMLGKIWETKLLPRRDTLKTTHILVAFNNSRP